MNSLIIQIVELIYYLAAVYGLFILLGFFVFFSSAQLSDVPYYAFHSDRDMVLMYLVLVPFGLGTVGILILILESVVEIFLGSLSIFVILKRNGSLKLKLTNIRRILFSQTIYLDPTLREPEETEEFPIFRNFLWCCLQMVKYAITRRIEFDET